MNHDVPLKVAIVRGDSRQNRRIRLHKPTIEVVKRVVGEWVRGGFSLNYIDDEGDEILMDTKEEWEECLNVWREGHNTCSFVKIVIRAGARSRASSISSIASIASSVASTTSLPLVSGDAMDTTREVVDMMLSSQNKQTASILSDEETSEEESTEDEEPVPIEDTLAALTILTQDEVQQEEQEQEQEQEEPEQEEVAQSVEEQPQIPFFDQETFDPVPSPPLSPTAEGAIGEMTVEEVATAETTAHVFYDPVESAKVEKIARRLFGGAYVDLMIDGVMTPESLGCGDWLSATLTSTTCYFKVTSLPAIVQKLISLGETQYSKHDFEGAALWFEMSTDLDADNATAWYNSARVQAKLNRVECVAPLTMALGLGGDEILSKALAEPAFATVEHLQEFKDCIPGYRSDYIDASAPPAGRQCAGCELMLLETCLPNQKYCCGRCRSGRQRGHTQNCRGRSRHNHCEASWTVGRSHHGFRYQEELGSLTSMGFTDVDRLKCVLEARNGDVSQCLQDLLN